MPARRSGKAFKPLAYEIAEMLIFVYFEEGALM